MIYPNCKKNISAYKLSYEDDEFTLEYRIDGSDLLKYQPDKIMKVQLTGTYIIIVRESPYWSADVYNASVTRNIATDIIGISILISTVIFVFGLICFAVAFSISKKKNTLN